MEEQEEATEVTWIGNSLDKTLEGYEPGKQQRSVWSVEEIMVYKGKPSRRENIGIGHCLVQGENQWPALAYRFFLFARPYVFVLLTLTKA